MTSTVTGQPGACVAEAATFPPFDAEVIADLLAGRDIDLDDQRISAENRDLVRLMARTPVQNRAELWEEYVACSLSEAAASICAIQWAPSP